MTGRVEGRTVVITGGASGFGAQSGRRLVEEGARVALTDIDEARGEAVASELGEAAIFVRHDVTREADWRAAIEAAEDAFGPLTGLVNSAGVGGKTDNIETVTDEEWQWIIDVNLTGSFLGCQAGVAAMRRAGGGSIVNLCSVLGLRGAPDALAYCASKGGVQLLTKSVAIHCGQAKTGIRCNAICPGYMRTPMLEPFLEADPEMEPALLKRHPVGRLGNADDIAKMVVYLISDESEFVTGADMVVDGGFTA